ncbi:pyridoxal phosphate-dependent transferase [Dipodascopsis uninucleata]
MDNGLEIAKVYDSEDEVAVSRSNFLIPTRAQITKNLRIDEPNKPSIYLCGNSLGLLPKRSKQLINEELDVWATHGVTGHFNHERSRPWVTIDETVTGKMAKIVGAKTSEVAVMTTLTTNLHLLMTSFYRPDQERFKIIIEKKAFPSDHYAVESQIRLHGLNPDEAIVLIEPRAGEYLIRTNDIFKSIDEHGSSAALLLLPGIQYYTGQAFEIEKITAYAKRRGLVVGWDLAHAAGNLEIYLHDWNVDFAVWCTYKYLNSGPGGIGGLFVHELQSSRQRLSGWWGHNKISRFQMNNEYNLLPGAAGFQLSNPSVLDTVSLLGSLEEFSKYSMSILRKKSVKLTGYLESLLISLFPDKPFTILTPSESDQRGCQLSLLFKPGIMDSVFKYLSDNGVTVDERRPDVIRVAPTPLYNSYSDVWHFTQILRAAVDSVD